MNIAEFLLPGMHKKIILPNGLRLILAPMKESPSAAVLVLVGTGSKYETKEINGLSHFLEHMFFKGTKKRSNTLAVSEALDRVGGQYNAFTSQEMTGYWAKVAADKLDVALDWVSDILLNSKFDAAEIEREKGVIIEEINMYYDMPMRYVGNLWEQLLYGDQPAGWDIAGSKEIVASFSRAQFVNYLKNQYRTENTIICLSGKLPDMKVIEKKIGQYFGKINKGASNKKLAVFEKQEKPETLVHFKKTDQTHLCLGVRAYDLRHPDRFVLSVMAALLGGMMSSRLWISVREKKGLAYYVRTVAEKYTDSGYLVTQAGVANDKVEEAIEAILVEYRKIRDQKVTPGEIQKAKDYLIGHTLLGLETADELASWLGTQEVLQGKILSLKQVFDKIKAVDATALQRVARDIFQPAKLNLALIGPFKEKEKFEKLLKI
jgi:predicted Zn-dependent peptidase